MATLLTPTYSTSACATSVYAWLAVRVSACTALTSLCLSVCLYSSYVHSVQPLRRYVQAYDTNQSVSLYCEDLHCRATILLTAST